MSRGTGLASLVLIIVALCGAAGPLADPGTVATDPCPLLDEGEGEGEGEPDNAAAPGVATRLLRHVVPLSAAAIVLALAFPAGRRRIGDRKATAVLVICAVLAVGVYAALGRSNDGRFVNGWEFFHYYLGSKYAPELGYDGLYAAALIADVETGRKFGHAKDAVRNLEDGACIPVEDVLSRRESIVGRFSPDRWTAFTADVRHFKSVLSADRWNGVFRDKGYNATPIWTLIVAPLTNRIPTSSAGGLLVLSLLDPLLLLLAVVVVWRTFGRMPALLLVVLIGTHMTMSHSHFKGALLRTDWVVWLLLAVCALAARRPGTGGFLVALSAASRIFPAFFALGLLAGPLVAATPERRREHLRFAAVFAVTLVVLVLAAGLVCAPGTWSGFADKIWQHNDSFSPWRVGFKHLFLGASDYRPDSFPSHQDVFHDRRAAWWTIQALVLAGFLYLSRRLESWEVLALGFVPTFFLVAPTYYYYVMLAVPLLFFGGRLDRPERAVGVAWLLASSSIAYAIEGAVGRELPLFYALSLIAFVVCALLTLNAWQVEAAGCCVPAALRRLRHEVGFGRPLLPESRTEGLD